MPTLDAFPKAHQVTFKYYVGVIYFLEENYEEVRQRDASNQAKLLTPFSPRRTSPKPGNYATKTRSGTKSEFSRSRLTESTNVPQTHSDLPNPMPPAHHPHPANPRPPITIPTPPANLPPALPLHQEGRPIRLRRGPRRRRRRIRQTTHLPNPRARPRHRAP